MIALAGCGSDRGSGGSRTVGADRAVTLRMDEYVFRPQDLTASRGRLRVTVVNDGELAHNWKIFRRSDAQERDELGGTETFQPGRRRTARLKLRPGSYRIVCTVGNHEDLGMAGKLVVR